MHAKDDESNTAVKNDITPDSTVKDGWIKERLRKEVPIVSQISISMGNQAAQSDIRPKAR
jgi:hypothetical protein